MNATNAELHLVPFNGSTERALKDLVWTRVVCKVGVPFNGSTERALKDWRAFSWFSRCLSSIQRLNRESTEREVAGSACRCWRKVPFNGSTERALKENEIWNEGSSFAFVPFNGSTERALKGASTTVLAATDASVPFNGSTERALKGQAIEDEYGEPAVVPFNGSTERALKVHYSPPPANQTGMFHSTAQQREH